MELSQMPMWRSHFSPFHLFTLSPFHPFTFSPFQFHTQTELLKELLPPTLFARSRDVGSVILWENVWGRAEVYFLILEVSTSFLVFAL